MPKFSTKFNTAMRAEFPFLKLVDGSESEVLCTLCSAKFNISNGGRTLIKQHVGTSKHIKAASTVNNNQSMSSFLVNNEAMDLLRGKELTFAYHSAKHQISTRATDCSSKLEAQFFESTFTCGATKSSKLVQQVILILFQ